MNININMKYMKSQKWVFILLCIFLLFLLFRSIDYLVKNNYIIECFTNKKNKKNQTKNQNNENETQTVDLPLNTIYSCQNFCGPTARCAITGQQCFYDSDCPGCKEEKKKDDSQKTTNIPGDDSAGKLTVGVTPRYSPLTTGYGTKEKLVDKNMYSKTPSLNLGLNKWREKFDEELEKYDKEYRPKDAPFMQEYVPFYSVTGEFEDDGPLPSNI